MWHVWCVCSVYVVCSSSMCVVPGILGLQCSFEVIPCIARYMARVAQGSQDAGGVHPGQLPSCKGTGRRWPGLGQKSRSLHHNHTTFSTTPHTGKKEPVKGPSGVP